MAQALFFQEIFGFQNWNVNELCLKIYLNSPLESLGYIVIKPIDIIGSTYAKPFIQSVRVTPYQLMWDKS